MFLCVTKLLVRTSDPKTQLFLHRTIILTVTFMIYTTYHLSRKPMSVVKSRLENNKTGWEPFNKENGKTLLSVMDGLYWGTYAICMFITGFLAERSNIRYFLSGALILCGIMCIINGLANPFQIHSVAFFIIIQILNGAVQTSGWPSVIAIVGSWFSSSKKGLIFGVWNSHTSVGNILGLAIAGAFVDNDWSFSFIVPGLICIGMAIVTFLFVIPKPKDIGIDLDHLIPSPTDRHKPSNRELDVETKLATNLKENQQAISFFDALKISGVVEFSFCLAFAKSVSYIFLNWLPFYFKHTYNESSSSSAFRSILFDIGGLIGSIIAGLLADITQASGLICIGFLGLAIPFLYLFHQFANCWWSMILIFMCGFYINGPYALITTAVSTNLACKVPSRSAMATVSAIIDGTGSIGAAIGPAIIGPLVEKFQWSVVFYLSMLADLIALLCLLRIGYEEFKKIFNSY